MAKLVAGYGTSHSPMLAASLEDWLGGAFLARDKARAFVDLDGEATRYDAMLARAPAGAMERIAPDLLRIRHAEKETAIARLRGDIAAARLDALIVVGDDQEELFDLGNMPSIGIYYGASIPNAGATHYPCHEPLARHLIGALQDDGFDLSTMNRAPAGKGEGHAFSFVHKFLMNDAPIPIVPVFLNAYYPPNQPSPARCHALGEALRRAVAAYRPDARIGVLASGGLSHFLVDEPFDRAVIAALRSHDSAFFRTAPLHKLRSGSSEIRNWICLAGAVSGMAMDWVSYVPGYRTPALTGTGLCFASFRGGESA